MKLEKLAHFQNELTFLLNDPQVWSQDDNNMKKFTTDPI